MTPVYNAFVYFVWFLATFYTVFFFLSLIVYEGRIFEGKALKRRHNSLVTVLVPAYNEGENISDAISSLKGLTYPHVEIIILNDGSNDNTAEVVRKHIKNDARFRFIDNAVNKGKAATLNQGIGLANGAYVACMDADSSVELGILEKVLPYFDGGSVGAVTVSVAVKNPKSFLEKVVAMEFLLGLSLFLKISSFLDCVNVTPGPFSVYSRRALKKIGGFDSSNITEDLEIAYRLHKSGYKIRNCIEAKVCTTLPASFRKIYVQRRRWYSGAIRTGVQHRDMMFNARYNFFGFFVPFNFGLVFLGLGLFIASVFLLVSRLVQQVLYYRYTNFNFLDHLSLNFNILNYGTIDMLGLTIFLSTVGLMAVGIVVTRHRFRDNKLGVLGFPFMFLLYQVFWLGSIIAVFNRNKIKWR